MAVTLTGQRFTTISANGNRIINVGAPTDPTDAATMAYVDANSGGGGLTEDQIQTLADIDTNFDFERSIIADDGDILDTGFDILEQLYTASGAQWSTFLFQAEPHILLEDIELRYEVGGDTFTIPTEDVITSGGITDDGGLGFINFGAGAIAGAANSYRFGILTSDLPGNFISGTAIAGATPTSFGYSIEQIQFVKLAVHLLDDELYLDGERVATRAWVDDQNFGGGGITDLSSFTTDNLSQGTTNLYNIPITADDSEGTEISAGITSIIQGDGVTLTNDTNAITISSQNNPGEPFTLVGEDVVNVTFPATGSFIFNNFHDSDQTTTFQIAEDPATIDGLAVGTVIHITANFSSLTETSIRAFTVVNHRTGPNRFEVTPALSLSQRGRIQGGDRRDNIVITSSEHAEVTHATNEGGNVSINVSENGTAHWSARGLVTLAGDGPNVTGIAQDATTGDVTLTRGTLGGEDGTGVTTTFDSTDLVFTASTSMLAGAENINASGTTDITVTDGSIFSVDDIIQLTNEAPEDIQFEITAINGNVLTVQVESGTPSDNTYPAQAVQTSGIEGVIDISVTQITRGGLVDPTRGGVIELTLDSDHGFIAGGYINAWISGTRTVGEVAYESRDVARWTYTNIGGVNTTWYYYPEQNLRIWTRLDSVDENEIANHPSTFNLR